MSRQDQKKWSTRVQGLLIQDDESHDILEQTSHVVGTKLVWKKECPLLIVFSVEFSKNSLWGAQIAPPPRNYSMWEGVPYSQEESNIQGFEAEAI